MTVTAEQAKAEFTVDRLQDEYDLTPLQAAFVMALQVDPIPTRAYFLAGGSAHDGASAAVNAHKMLKVSKVRLALMEIRESRAKRTEIEADDIVLMLWANAKRAMQYQPAVDSQGEPTGDFVYNGTVANKALELLGKHFGIFEKDNKQRNVPLTEAEVEAVKQKLRERGIDLDRVKARSPN